MGKLINPATNKPFVEVQPNQQIIRLRESIMRHLQAKYDVAQTTSQNQMHWIWADELSPHAANELPIRKKLRSRSRYEVANNGYLKGILLTLANDFVGSGPTLQITDARFTPEQKLSMERQWSRRAKRIKLRRKLWQLRFAKIQDGEAFAFDFLDLKAKSPVKINWRVFECDQVSHDQFNYKPDKKYLEIDGVRFNRRSGEPEYYHLMYSHPGETVLTPFMSNDGEWIRAEDVIHWFRRERQYLRGIPETISSLPLWALLRRYTLAVVQNAEIAADFTVLLQSLQPPGVTAFPLSGSGQPTQEDPQDWFSSFPIDRGLMTVLPSLYEMKQLDPKQPVTMYDNFVNALVQEAARPLLVPRNLAIGNSGGYNMASGTLDRQLYRGAINEERLDAETEVLDRDLEQWWFEAIRTRDYFEDEVGGASVQEVVSRFLSLREEPPDHRYRWDEVPEHTDPVKVAAAIDLLHKGGHISDIDIQEGRYNRRVEEHYENLRLQKEAREELGLAIGPAEQILVDPMEEGEDEVPAKSGAKKKEDSTEDEDED